MQSKAREDMSIKSIKSDTGAANSAIIQKIIVAPIAFASHPTGKTIAISNPGLWAKMALGSEVQTVLGQLNSLHLELFDWA